MAERFDAIVVGAGPAGASAAAVLARAGLDVVLLERGEYPGEKNVMGGVLYRRPTEEVMPGFWREAPLERPVTGQQYWLLSRDGALTFGFRDLVPGGAGRDRPAPVAAAAGLRGEKPERPGPQGEAEDRREDGAQNTGGTGEDKKEGRQRAKDGVDRRQRAKDGDAAAPDSYTVLRARFDRWFAGRAREAGALLVTETVAVDLLKKNGRTVGVRTDRPEGDLYADVVIIADGANSLLTEQAGLREEISPATMVLALKEIISLPAETIEDRFGLEKGEGMAIEVFGDATYGMLGSGFIYTNRDSLSVGVGAVISHLREQRLRSPDLLDYFKSHPVIRRLIAGGRTAEYMAHLIPEGGLRGMPGLVADGVLVAGDAAQLVNPLRREGSNYAMISGKYAAEAVLRARKQGDVSARGLASYRDAMARSFIMKDLQKFRHAIPFLDSRREFFSLYPEILTGAVRDFLAVDMRPIREKQRDIWREVTARRSRRRMLRDAVGLWRVLR